MMTLLALGNGMMRPPNMGMISLLTPADQQGVALGVTNSLSSLGRIIGPLLGGWLYQSSQGAPFFSAAALVVLSLIVVAVQFSRLPKSGKNSLD
jgi:MFS transporter, DHA1 family, tetracycline resistance protein